MATEAPWFSPISSKAQAIAELKGISNILIFLSVLGVATGWFVDTLLINAIQAVFYVVIAILLRKTQSRIVAIVFFIGVLSLAVATLWMLRDHPLKGSWVLYFLLLWASKRAVEATFKLRGRFSLPN